MADTKGKILEALARTEQMRRSELARSSGIRGTAERMHKHSHEQAKKLRRELNRPDLTGEERDDLERSYVGTVTAAARAQQVREEHTVLLGRLASL